MHLKSTLSRLPAALREAKASFLASLLQPKPKRTHLMTFVNPKTPNPEGGFIYGDVWIQPTPSNGNIVHYFRNGEWVQIFS
ncbi:Hypothetical Protein OBI_RACECAR_72 [Arthrobacter phage Racecar]|nr:hypothetical protein PBI_RACECAR_154 [Arthrobacter phage Racecar]QFG12828.1 hypothetical protein PBI_MIMI_151 [Arthrobacter phage Mimi]